MKRILCVFLMICILLCPVSVFTSCGNDTVYSLGPYEIKEDHYRYLASIYNRKLFVANGIDGASWDSVLPTSQMTVAQTVDSYYTEEFLTSIFTLLYSQLLFDVYSLEMPKEMTDTINENVETVIAYYGGLSEQVFDQNAKVYGFTAKTLREVYTMQMKQTLVVQHLFGEKGSKIEKERLDEIFKKNYFCFQTIVINNKYKFVTETDKNGKEVEVMEALTDYEVQERNDIIDDLYNLFIEPSENYVYKVIDPTMTYDEIYARYSDDTAYPQGCYTTYPTAGAQNAITAAALLRENDIARVIAKRYFQSGGSFELGGEKVTIGAGDYFEYGYVFVKRLPIAERAYERDEYKTFFEGFMDTAVATLFAEHLAEFEKNGTSYTLKDMGIAADMPLSSVAPNNMDYNLIYAEQESANESESSK